MNKEEGMDLSNQGQLLGTGWSDGARAVSGVFPPDPKEQGKPGEAVSSVHPPPVAQTFEAVALDRFQGVVASLLRQANLSLPQMEAFLTRLPAWITEVKGGAQVEFHPRGSAH